MVDKYKKLSSLVLLLISIGILIFALILNKNRYNDLNSKFKLSKNNKSFWSNLPNTIINDNYNLYHIKDVDTLNNYLLNSDRNLNKEHNLDFIEMPQIKNKINITLTELGIEKDYVETEVNYQTYNENNKELLNKIVVNFPNLSAFMIWNKKKTINKGNLLVELLYKQLNEIERFLYIQLTQKLLEKVKSIEDFNEKLLNKERDDSTNIAKLLYSKKQRSLNTGYNNNKEKSNSFFVKYLLSCNSDKTFISDCFVFKDYFDNLDSNYINILKDNILKLLEIEIDFNIYKYNYVIDQWLSLKKNNNNSIFNDNKNSTYFGKEFSDFTQKSFDNTGKDNENILLNYEFVLKNEEDSNYKYEKAGKSIFYKKNIEAIFDLIDENKDEEVSNYLIKNLQLDEDISQQLCNYFKYIINTAFMHNKEGNQSFYQLANSISQELYHHSYIIGNNIYVYYVTQEFFKDYNKDKKVNCSTYLKTYFLNNNLINDICRINNFDFVSEDYTLNIEKGYNLINLLLFKPYEFTKNRIFKIEQLIELSNCKNFKDKINKLTKDFVTALFPDEGNNNDKDYRDIDFTYIGLNSILFNKGKVFNFLNKNINQINIKYKDLIHFREYENNDNFERETIIGSFDYHENGLFNAETIKKYLYKDMQSNNNDNISVFVTYLKKLYLFLDFNYLFQKLTLKQIQEGYISESITKYNNKSFLNGGIKDLNPKIDIFNDYIHNNINYYYSTGKDNINNSRNIISIIKDYPNNKNILTKSIKYKGNNEGFDYTYVNPFDRVQKLNNYTIDGYQSILTTKNKNIDYGIYLPELGYVFKLSNKNSDSNVKYNKALNVNVKNFNLENAEYNKENNNFLKTYNYRSLPYIVTNPYLEDYKDNKIISNIDYNFEKAKYNKYEIKSNNNYCKFESNTGINFEFSQNFLYSLHIENDALFNIKNSDKNNNYNIIPLFNHNKNFMYNFDQIYSIYSNYYHYSFVTSILLYISTGFITMFFFVLIYLLLKPKENNTLEIIDNNNYQSIEDNSNNLQMNTKINSTNAEYSIQI